MWNAGLTHCITSPLLLPITLVYFCAKHVVDKYCLLYVRPHTLKNSGAFASTHQPHEPSLCAGLKPHFQTSLI